MTRPRAFTLIELTVAGLLMLVAVAAIAAFLQRAGAIATSQHGGIDLQQNRRGAERELTRALLLAGRGGLPAGRALPNPAPPAGTVVPYRLPAGLALRVDNNVAAGRRIVATPDSPRVAEGSDVLVVRAVFGELWHLAKDALSRDAPTAVTGRLVVPREGRDLYELEQALAAKQPLALILGSAADADTYGVAELMAETSTVESGRIVLAFRFYEPANPANPSGGPAKTYGELGPEGVFPLELFRQGAATVGILRELRFYIRHLEPAEVPRGEDPGDRLARAEVLPGLEVAAAPDDPLAFGQDLAFGIADLQVALGFDTPIAARLADGAGLYAAADGRNDDWLFNAPGESGTGPPFGDLSPFALEEVEVSLLARSARPDRSQIAPPIDHLGDRPGTELNTPEARSYRRALAIWRTQLRNL